MKLKHILNKYILGLILFVSFSCTDKVVVHHNVLSNDFSKIIKYMLEYDSIFDTYSIKYTGRFTSEDSDFKFRGILRILKGKKIWVSIAPIGVEIVRILFTPTEIKFINRQNKTYFIGDYQYIKNKFNVDINYSLLEQVLTNRFLFLGKTNKPIINVSPKGLLLVEDYQGQNRLNYSLNPSLNRLTSVIFNNISDKSSISIDFSNFIDVESQTLPQNINIEFSKDDNKHSVKAVYKKITVNKNISTLFRIPPKFEQVWL